MAQLRSFRFIEPDVEGGERQASSEIVHEDASSTSSTSPASSPSSIGAQLTSTENSATDECPTSTLGSHEEYQVAQLDVGGDSSESIESQQQQQQQQQTKQLRLNIAQASEPQKHMSPALQRRAASPQSENGSTPPIVSNNPNQFEIRWRNINLLAAKASRWPRFVTDSSLYKLFASDASADSSLSSSSSSSSNEELDEKRNAGTVYYSPPLKHRTLNVLGGTEDTKTSLDVTPVQTHSRCILNNISGSVFSGQLTAVLGPSGVGKTTLLNSLTGRNTLDGTGRVVLLGAGAAKRLAVCTVPQADVLPGKLSVNEDLTFTSQLKNPQHTRAQHEHNIGRIVRHMHMAKFLHTRIDKLSGGEARRLSIARELLSSPDILILDEPTSGLDANTCKKIITALRDIVEHSEHILDRPMSIIVTIHQPQKEVLDLFHRVYVMALGGRAIYEGAPAQMMRTLLDCSTLPQVVAAAGGEPLNDNPAIVALEVASGEYGAQVIQELAAYHETQQAAASASACPTPAGTPLRKFRNSPRTIASSPAAGTPKRLLRGCAPPASANTQDAAPPGSPGWDRVSNVTTVSYASTWDAELPDETSSRLKVDKRLRRSVVTHGDLVAHTRILMRRCWLLTTRDLFLMAIRILGFLLVAAGTVQIFSHALHADENQCPQYETEVDDMLAFMDETKSRLLNLSSSIRQSMSTHLFFFHLVLNITIVTSALTGLVFPLQMRMFVREYKNGWYSAGSFVLSQTLAELPVDLIGPTLTLLIAYPLCNQPTSAYYWRECGYIAVLALASIICKSQAQIVGAFLMNSVENSVFMSCVMVTLPALLSGLAVRVRQMAYPLQVLSYGSFLRYACESLFLLRYGYEMCPCDPQLVYGYPIRASPAAIPPQLNSLARNLIELAPTTNSSSSAISDGDDDSANMFVSFMRLVTSASNQFVPQMHELGSCERYRSLYLIDMDIADRILPQWLALLLVMFVISRFLTYFAVRAVIKLSR